MWPSLLLMGATSDVVDSGQLSMPLVAVSAGPLKIGPEL